VAHRKVEQPEQISLTVLNDGIVAARFGAMACPCEVLMETTDLRLAHHLGGIVAQEAWRVEQKFSRYRAGNIVSHINNANGRPIELDAETASLLDFSQDCYHLSKGLFDITSGILRRVWHFDGSDHVPDQSEIAPLLNHIGFNRIVWSKPLLTLPAGMELDFGGLAKEYAVDKAIGLVSAETEIPVLINFGGDLRAQSRPSAGPWRVGIEKPDHEGIAALLSGLTSGALATSGDTRRFLLRNGVRYSHILNPKTGWPVAGGPNCVTVAAATCIEAGMIATMALLQGATARLFLEDAGVPHWCGV
jgi:thiamine biosynthesis lipoprotein